MGGNETFAEKQKRYEAGKPERKLEREKVSKEIAKTGIFAAVAEAEKTKKMDADTVPTINAKGMQIANKKRAKEGEVAQK